MHDFLAQTEWASATIQPLAGDASSRRYFRLSLSGDTAILMDAGQGAAQQLNQFERLARFLTDHGLSAPKILASDFTQFLLIEDLGDAVFSQVVAADPSQEITLYTRAVDALLATPTPDFIAPYGPVEMTHAIKLFFDWYPQFSDKLDVDTEKIASFLENFERLLAKHLTRPPTFIHRDFHAENLVWLPERGGAPSVGLLDFQDAVMGDPAYDVASLLYDARRDVSTATQHAVIDHFIKQTNADRSKFMIALSICTAQRNIRILGIFTKLCVEDGKSHYTDLMPRVWRDLMTAFKHPVLHDIKTQFLELAASPTPPVITRIRNANA